MGNGSVFPRQKHVNSVFKEWIEDCEREVWKKLNITVKESFAVGTFLLVEYEKIGMGFQQEKSLIWLQRLWVHPDV